MSGDGDVELRQVDGAQLVDRAQVVMHQPRPPVPLVGLEGVPPGNLTLNGIIW